MKKQHKHPVMTTIHPDRFMYKNRTEVESLRKNVDILRKKITFLKDCLAKYTDFESSGISVEGALGKALQFFATQGQNQTPETSLQASDMADIEVHLPLSQAQIIGVDPVKQMLDSYHKKVQS